MHAVAGLQSIQQQAAASAQGVGFGRMPNPFDVVAGDFAVTPPMERPVIVVEGAMPVEAAALQDPPSAGPSVPSTTLRQAFLDKLPAGSFAGVLELLDGGAVRLSVETVDQLVALASSLVDASDAVGTDHLLLSIALYLRSVVDAGGGWGGDNDADDVRAAGDSLLAAADAVVAQSDPIVAVAFRLATLLDAKQPRDVHTKLVERFAGVAEALRSVGAHGLLYATAGQLLSAETGSFTPVGSTLPTRILVVGNSPVPHDVTVSFVRSGAQVIELAHRSRRPLTEAAVFVANPRRDRQQASMDALLLRRTFYPRSTGLGETVEDVDGDGTPEDVRTRLDASMLDLGCGVTADGGLELAGPAILEPAQIVGDSPATAGGLAVLPSVATGALALTEALLASRFVGVIRIRDTIPDDVASLLHFLLHAQLVDARSDPASAVAAVHCWLADPHRTSPDYLPPWYVARAGDPDLADPAYGHALIHHGV